jgi:hypothetical protein
MKQEHNLPGGWKVDIHVDDDNHITIVVKNSDGTKVHDVGEDLATNDEEWVARFTTESIEKEYNEGHDPDCCDHGLPHFCSICDGQKENQNETPNS